LWLDGEELRRRPPLDRKAALRRIIPRPYGRLLYVDHLLEHGRALYEAACGWDLEGIVAKRKDSRYVSTRAELAEDQESWVQRGRRPEGIV
jgi:bifunctional non-homologous end joining protein LigD